MLAIYIAPTLSVNDFEQSFYLLEEREINSNVIDDFIAPSFILCSYGWKAITNKNF